MLPITKAKLKLTLTCMGVGAGIAYSTLAATPAHADQGSDHLHDMRLMCQLMDANPTLAGVDDVAKSWLLQQGTSDQSAALGADTLIDAVKYVCPQYASLVIQWANTHHSSTNVSAVV